jgi:hypothetical protein
MVRRAWVLLLGVVSVSCGGSPEAAQNAPAAVRQPERGAASDLPRIALTRLDTPPPESPLGSRDIFDYGPPPTTQPPPPPPTTAPAPTLAPVVTAPTPPPLPPLNVKYVGAVEQRGVKVAMFLTDTKEMLTGQAGEVVANRFRIVKIGLESVDIQEVGAEHVRRIPLRGN